MKKSKLRKIIRESIEKLMVEQGNLQPCIKGDKALQCANTMSALTNSGFISNMQSLVASPNGCHKLIMKEHQIGTKYYGKIGTQPCTGPNGEFVHRVCNGQNPLWVGQLIGRESFINQMPEYYECTSNSTCDHVVNGQCQPAA